MTNTWVFPTNGHTWIPYRNLIVCSICGIVQRKDGKNSICKGPAIITLRKYEQ